MCLCVYDVQLNSKLQALKTSTTTTAASLRSATNDGVGDDENVPNCSPQQQLAAATTKQPPPPPPSSNHAASRSKGNAAAAAGKPRPRIGILPRPSTTSSMPVNGLIQDFDDPYGSALSPNDEAATATLGIRLPALLQKDDDYGGHQRCDVAVAGVEPIVKILRRPEHERATPVAVERPRQPIKTLQQRKAEYAEARLRILGSAAAAQTTAAVAEKGGDNGGGGGGGGGVSSPQQQQQQSSPSTE